jgi:uncharacterized protein (TIGR00725 family)
VLVAVVGKGRNCPFDTWRVAIEVGKAVARAGHTVVTGGLGGVMFAAALGAVAEGGQAIGFIPAGGVPDENFAGLVIPTGLSEPVRNVLIGSCCDAMLACWGSHGTLQELAVATDREVPVAGVVTPAWDLLPGVDHLELDGLDAWLTTIV